MDFSALTRNSLKLSESETEPITAGLPPGLRRQGWGAPTAKRTVPLSAVVVICGFLFLLGGFGWGTSVHYKAELHDMAAQLAVEKQKTTQAADEGYAAAVSNVEQAAPVHSIGYVYLGKCDKVWIAQHFGQLPPTCDSSIPSEGVRIISWKGDVVHSSIPTTVNGERVYGKPLGRVSAGYSLILHSILPVSAYPSGPQYYWGKVEIPEGNLRSP